MPLCSANFDSHLATSATPSTPYTTARVIDWGLEIDRVEISRGLR